MRRAILPAALIALAIGGFTTASVIGSDDPPAQPPHGILDAGGLAGVAGSDAVDLVKTDPQGKGPEWAVTVFRAKNGQTCVEPGRMQGNKAGDFTPDGRRFVPYPIEEGGSCTDLSAVPAGVQITRRLNENRTTVHGVAGPKVRQITLTIGGASHELAIGRSGAFFTVLDGLLTPDDIDVSATLKDGSVVALL